MEFYLSRFPTSYSCEYIVFSQLTTLLDLVMSAQGLRGKRINFYVSQETEQQLEQVVHGEHYADRSEALRALIRAEYTMLTHGQSIDQIKTEPTVDIQAQLSDNLARLSKNLGRRQAALAFACYTFGVTRKLSEFDIPSDLDILKGGEFENSAYPKSVDQLPLAEKALRDYIISRGGKLKIITKDTQKITEIPIETKDILDFIEYCRLRLEVKKLAPAEKTYEDNSQDVESGETQ